MVVGSVAKGGSILRSGAKPGDLIYVTGSLGGSRATLQRLFDGGKVSAKAAEHRRHFYPKPRIEVGAFLQRKKLATAMIDLSDGISTDLSHICKESGVGAVMNEQAVPIAAGANLDFALHGGEDYELLFTASARKKIPSTIVGVKVTEIGRVTREKKMVFAGSDGRKRRLESRGWEHFKS
jgi:thiamine-monophosphate kinase